MEVGMRKSDLFIQPKRPWNAGRLVGPKAPLKPKHIWATRQQLKVVMRLRDLAMFNCALDSISGRMRKSEPSHHLGEPEAVRTKGAGRPQPTWP